MLAMLTASATPVYCSAPIPIKVYYQGQALSASAEGLAIRIRALGHECSTSDNGVHQFQAWANCVRYFHREDNALATLIRDHLAPFSHPSRPLGLVDLSEAFKDRKVSIGTIEVWICDLAANAKLPKAAYEKDFANWQPPAWHAGTGVTEYGVTITATPDDEYCYGWDPPQRSAFLDRVKGLHVRNDGSALTSRGQAGANFWGPAVDPSPLAGRCEFVFFETPAYHGHGAPLGTCGTRLIIYKDGVACGFWEDIDAGAIYDIWPGDRHCSFRLNTEASNYGGKRTAYLIVDAEGKITYSKYDYFPMRAIWIPYGQDEALWQLDEHQISLTSPEGKSYWTITEDAVDYRNFFSADRRFAFRQLTSQPDGAIYHPDGKETWRFKIPFREVKGQKGFLGLNSAGELVLRVDRKIYRVDHEGHPNLEAVLPVYKNRVRSLETMRPGFKFDVESEFGLEHSYEYVPNSEHVRDHPRPRLKFDIEKFEGQESLDEGKSWHAISLRPTEDSK